MILAFLFFLLGLAVMIVGSELLVRGASNVAKMANMSDLTIGLTLVSIGTSSPELFVSLNAALLNQDDLVVGNIIGSNISNILLGLGFGLLFTSILLKKQELIEDIIILLLLTATAYYCLYDGFISLVDGIILLLIMITYIVYQIFIKKVEGEPIEKKSGIFLNLILVILSIAMLYFGSEILIYNSVKIAEYFKVPESIIGLSLVAIGSSLPEIVTCIVASYKKNTKIIIGNIIGSNIFNITGMLGISAIGKYIYSKYYNSDIKESIIVNSDFINFDIPIMLLLTILVFIIAVFLNKLSRIFSIIFIGSYFGYIYYSYKFITG